MRCSWSRRTTSGRRSVGSSRITSNGLAHESALDGLSHSGTRGRQRHHRHSQGAAQPLTQLRRNEAGGERPRLWSPSAHAHLGTDFRVFVGLEELSFPMMAVGACGLMNAVGNLQPRILADLCEAVWRNDLSGAQALHHRLFEINQAVFFDTNPIPIKYMMKRLGILLRNEHRLPMVPATPELERRLDRSARASRAPQGERCLKWLNFAVRRAHLLRGRERRRDHGCEVAARYAGSGSSLPDPLARSRGGPRPGPSTLRGLSAGGCAHSFSRRTAHALLLHRRQLSRAQRGIQRRQRATPIPEHLHAQPHLARRARGAHRATARVRAARL